MGIAIHGQRKSRRQLDSDLLGGESGRAIGPERRKIVADFMVGERLPAIKPVIVLQNEMRGFVADFAKRFATPTGNQFTGLLTRPTNSHPIALRRTRRRLLGSDAKYMPPRTRNGIGVTLISQRSAVLNKSCLNQSECLIAHQTTGPRNLKAIREWIEFHDSDKATIDKIMRTIPTLEVGEAWLYSPAWLKCLSECKFAAPRNVRFEPNA